MQRRLKCELYNDSMQNWKGYPIHKAQLIIADVPYNVGTNFYGSNPIWYKGGDNKNGESKVCWKSCVHIGFQLQPIRILPFLFATDEEGRHEAMHKRKIIRQPMHDCVLRI